MPLKNRIGSFKKNTSIDYFAFFPFKEIEGKILNRYAHRLLKLKVKFAEISIVVRPAPKVDPGVYRYCN